MKQDGLIGRSLLYFSKWSKKGYSLFVSLGREVKIARLSVHMYASVLLKSSLKGLIINTDHTLKIVLSLWKKEFKETLPERGEGEVYPYLNRFDSKWYKDILPQAVYPFLWKIT